jgi:hypothetical protein
MTVSGMTRLLNLTEVILEWGQERTKVYVNKGMIEWTDEAKYSCYRGAHISQLAFHIRTKTGCKVIMHSKGDSGITDVTGATIIHTRGVE